MMQHEVGKTMKTDHKFFRLRVCTTICFGVLISTACASSISDTGTLFEETVSVLGTDTSQLATQVNKQSQIDDAQQEAISNLSTQMPVDFDIATLTPSPFPIIEIPTSFPVCTPPECEPDETYHCPGDCPGGCGTNCATATSGISSGTGQVWGKICYAGETIPEMTIYLQETNTQEALEFPVAEDQDSYQLHIPAGVYVAYVWLPNIDIGGGYTQFVRCNPNISSCADHSLVPFLVQENHVITDVDICDWDTDKIVFPTLTEE